MPLQPNRPDSLSPRPSPRRPSSEPPPPGADARCAAGCSGRWPRACPPQQSERDLLLVTERGQVETTDVGKQHGPSLDVLSLRQHRQTSPCTRREAANPGDGRPGCGSATREPAGPGEQLAPTSESDSESENSLHFSPARPCHFFISSFCKFLFGSHKGFFSLFPSSLISLNVKPVQ